MASDFTPSARVIADSVSPAGNRLTTIEVTLHRFVLAQLLTHRVFSRNSASSRAIPVQKMLNRIRQGSVMPLVWASEQRGMQGGEELPPDVVLSARDTWLKARSHAVLCAQELCKLGVHKSIANRLLEPFMATTVIVSSTEWENFWVQRCSSLPQSELRAAAEAMRDVWEQSRPQQVDCGQWHLPYLDEDERSSMPSSWWRRVSAARCARVSYLTQDGRRDPQADLDLYQRLVSARPPHVSPLEHVATPCLPAAVSLPFGTIETHPPVLLGNFVGWRQLRHDVFNFESAEHE